MDQQLSQLSDHCIRLEQLYLAQRAELTEIKKWCAAFECENAESKKKRSLMEKIHPLPIYHHNGVLHKNITNQRFRCGVCNREGCEGNKKRNVMCPYAKKLTSTPLSHYTSNTVKRSRRCSVCQTFSEELNCGKGNNDRERCKNFELNGKQKG